MTNDQAHLLGEIHALADAVQQQCGRMCTVTVNHHEPRGAQPGAVHALVQISDYDGPAGETPRFVDWSTRDGIGLADIRDGMATWIAHNRRLTTAPGASMGSDDDALPANWVVEELSEEVIA